MVLEFKKLARTIQTRFPKLAGLKSSVQRANYRWRGIPHDPDFNALKQIQSASDEVILDVGANRGQSIESIQTVLRHQCSIHSFEANPLLAQQLTARFSKNKAVSIHGFGLGSQEGTFELYVPYYNGWMFDGLASFIESEARDWLKTRLYGFEESKLGLKKVTCTVRTLDSLKLNPAFIKMDVQGLEEDVLKGAIDTLNRSHPVVLLEEPTPQIAEFAAAINYSLLTFKDGTFLPGQPGGRSGFLVSNANSRGIEAH